MILKFEFWLVVLIVMVFMMPDMALAACRLNSDCPIANVCQGGSCVPDPRCNEADPPCYCDSAPPCALDEICSLRGKYGQCIFYGCENDLDCGLGEECDSYNYRCIVDVEADRDLDGVPDNVDTCPSHVDTGQDDLNNDGIGDICDDDDDGDGVPDDSDNCPRLANGNQLDLDGNGIGNRCEPSQLIISEDCSSYLSGGVDSDNDGIKDVCDKCRYLASASNFDSDGDGYGDACDPDKDGDTIRNIEDNCPGIPNQNQVDCNCNGMGDACDNLACDNAYCLSF